LDHGPGLSDMSLHDGHSTGGSLGLGMGAIMRLSSLCEIHTGMGRGTAILARVSPGRGSREQKPLKGTLTASGILTPKPGQEVCGDAWAEKWHGETQWLAIVDGLGHGPQAASAAAEAIRVFHQASATASPETVLAQAHAALKS